MLLRKVELSDECKGGHSSLFEKYPSLINSIEQEADLRTDSLHKELANSPWEKEIKSLQAAEARPGTEVDYSCLNSDYQGYSDFMGRAKKPIAESFWKDKISQQSKSDAVDIDVTDRLLLQRWRQKLDQTHNEWESQMEKDAQGDFDVDITKSLDQFQNLCDATDESSLDMSQFFDPSMKGMSEASFDELKKQVMKITQNDKAREICELMGKACSRSSKKPTRQNCAVSSKGKELDVQMKEEVVGLEFSNDISSVLPSELMFLDDPDAGILFDLKYSESQLLSYKKVGYQSTLVESEEEMDADQEDGKGPIILCIDTSGSMMGAPEEIAKSVTLFMATLAKKENRNCYLINFSSNIECLDLSSGVSSTALYQFLLGSFHGGTDVEPALVKGVDIMNTDSYKNADLLVISDMEGFAISESCIIEMEKLRKNGNMFLGLCVKDYAGHYSESPEEQFLDESWVYDVQKDTVRKRVLEA